MYASEKRHIEASLALRQIPDMQLITVLGLSTPHLYHYHVHKAGQMLLP